MSKQFEGTWEEVSARALEFDGRRVRLTLLDDERTKVGLQGPSNGRAAEEATRSMPPGVIPGRQHGKPYKEWAKEIGATEITDQEFDAFERAIDENRAMRRALTEDRKL